MTNVSPSTDAVSLSTAGDDLAPAHTFVPLSPSHNCRVCIHTGNAYEQRTHRPGKGARVALRTNAWAITRIQAHNCVRDTYKGSVYRSHGDVQDDMPLQSRRINAFRPAKPDIVPVTISCQQTSPSGEMERLISYNKRPESQVRLTSQFP